MLKWSEIRFKKGYHPRGQEMCVMEAVAFFTGEKHTAFPECSSPVIGAFCRTTNDHLSQAYRDRLKKIVWWVVGTNTGLKDENERAEIVRKFAKKFIGAAVAADADALKGLSADTFASWKAYIDYADRADIDGETLALFAADAARAAVARFRHLNPNTIEAQCIECLREMCGVGREPGWDTAATDWADEWDTKVEKEKLHDVQRHRGPKGRGQRKAV